MERHYGDSTQNARIKIDYSGIKPKVSFNYPSKKTQYRGSMFWTIFTSWILFIVFLFLILPALQEMYDAIQIFRIKDNESIRYFSCVDHYKSNYWSVIDSTCVIYARNKTRPYPFWDLKRKILKTEEDKSHKKDIFNLSLILIIIFLPPFLIYLPFKKKWNRLYPKWQALLSEKKIAVFKAEDVNKDNFIEIPLFFNVILDYKVTKDFSKYLRLMEIKEHKFKYLIRKKKIKRKVNEWLWYARFYFSKKPQTGKLEVIFK